MKYIVVADRKTGKETAIVFDEAITHLYVAQGVRRTHQTVSAGFCHLERESGLWKAHGNSDSLRIGHREVDSVLLTMMLTHGLSGLDLDNAFALAELGQYDVLAELIKAKGAKAG